LKNEGYVKVAKKSDIALSHMKEVQVNGQSVCLANIGGEYLAINNICSHEGGPLADGKLQGYEVECPWHQSKFDLRTGEVKAPPAVEPQGTYEVKIFGEDIMLKPSSGSPQAREESKGAASVVYTLVLQERQPIQGTDVLALKISKQERIEDRRMFQYTAGQYAFLDIGKVYNDPKGPVRHFTIASSPTEEFILISTRIRDSPYKKRLDSLQTGTEVKVRGPLGTFTLHEDYSKPAIFLSGGIGVTPFRSMIKYATDKNLPIRIIMFDSNRNEQNILFRTDFENCSKTNKNLRIIYTITDEQNMTVNKVWKGEKGKIDMAMLKRHLEPDDLENSIFYICGPPAMLKAMRELLEQNLQVIPERIKVEEFTGY
jgi:ferredoxin-NADP reductase/nitrite reductase/ring-hydroxylating ferredoxin subunit